MLAQLVQETMTRKLLDLRIMHTMRFAEWGSHEDALALATEAQELLEVAITNWTREVRYFHVDLYAIYQDSLLFSAYPPIPTRLPDKLKYLNLSTPPRTLNNSRLAMCFPVHLHGTNAHTLYSSPWVWKGGPLMACLVQGWCGDFHQLVCIEFVPELGEDLDLVVDLLDCVLFNMQRLKYMSFWLEGEKFVAERIAAMDEYCADESELHKDLNTQMSKLLRLYVSLAVFLTKASPSTCGF